MAVPVGVRRLWDLCAVGRGVWVGFSFLARRGQLSDVAAREDGPALRRRRREKVQAVAAASWCPSSTGETTPLWHGMSIFELAGMWELRESPFSLFCTM